APIAHQFCCFFIAASFVKRTPTGPCRLIEGDELECQYCFAIVSTFGAFWLFGRKCRCRDKNRKDREKTECLGHRSLPRRRAVEARYSEVLPRQPSSVAARTEWGVSRHPRARTIHGGFLTA